MKLRVVTWLLLSTVLAVAAKLNYSAGWLQTDIVALAEDELASLPDADAVKKSSQQFQQSLVWLLVGADGDARALAAATEQLAQQLSVSGHLQSVTYRWANDTQRAEFWDFLSPLRGQLLTRADRERLREQPQQAVQDQLSFIYSPQSAGAPLDFAQDPFSLFQRYLTTEGISIADNVVALENDIPVYSAGEQNFTLLRSLAAPMDMRGSIAQPLLKLRQQQKAWVQAQGLTLLVAGAPLHSEFAAAGAQREIRLIGGLSILAICLLCLLAFRSMRPLMSSLFAIGSGIAAGTAAVIALLGQMHILAFVFGTTVTGLAIDYAFHFTCNRLRGGAHSDKVSTDRDIMPGLVLGLLSSCLAFFALALTPFPLLQQMGVFVGFGLLGAWLTVVLLFPLLSNVRARELDFSGYFPRVPRWLYPAAVAALITGGAGSALVAKPASDLSLFYTPPDFLRADEQQLNELLTVRPASAYFLVRGNSIEQLLEREYILGARLSAARAAGQLRAFDAVSERMPPPQVQRADRQLLAEFYGSSEVRGFYRQLGYGEQESAEIQQGLQRPLAQIDFTQWLQRLPQTQRQLWLGCNADPVTAQTATETYCRSLVRIFGVTTEFSGTAVAEGLEGVSFRNPPQTIAQVLGKQRDQLLALLPVILLIATLVIALRTGWRAALTIAALPLASVSAAFALAVLVSPGINLFHVAALLLVFGIGIDYAVFGFFAHRREASYTLLAIVLAGITTLLGFGLLALSQTPAIADFGFTLAVGTVTTLLLAALYFSTNIFGGKR